MREGSEGGREGRKEGENEWGRRNRKGYWRWGPARARGEGAKTDEHFPRPVIFPVPLRASRCSWCSARDRERVCVCVCERAKDWDRETETGTV